MDTIGLSAKCKSQGLKLWLSSPGTALLSLNDPAVQKPGLAYSQVGTEDPWGGGGGLNDLIPTPKYHKGLGPKTPRP